MGRERAAQAVEAAVRQAATFVEANAEQPMSVDDIASACGLHVRTLYRNFNSEFRLSPKRYLRRCRLDRIRADLLVARPGLTVTTVAIRHGVTHLGRFAREYAAAFGEPPSATLRRAREAIGAPGAALAPTLPSGQ